MITSSLQPQPARRPARNTSRSTSAARPTLAGLGWAALVLALVAGLWPGSSHAADEISPAEKALFVNNQLGAVNLPAQLRYSYRKQGSLEAGFDDSVTIALRRTADGACCATSAEFLHGERALRLPDIEAAQGNPAILYFLERDIREMQRLTKGQPNYFRKRIRLAVFNGATLRPVQVAWAGKTIEAQEIQISPYLDDPLRERFAQLAGKQYTFTLADAVPGGLHSIRTRVAGASGAPPLLTEEMTFERVEAIAAKSTPASDSTAAALPNRQPTRP